MDPMTRPCTVEMGAAVEAAILVRVREAVEEVVGATSSVRITWKRYPTTEGRVGPRSTTGGSAHENPFHRPRAATGRSTEWSSLSPYEVRDAHYLHRHADARRCRLAGDCFTILGPGTG